MIDFSHRHPKLVLALWLALVAFGALGLPKIQLVRIFDSRDLPAQNALSESYKQYATWRGELNSFVVSYHRPEGILNAQSLAELLELEAQIKKFEGVYPDKVVSFASARTVVDEVIDGQTAASILPLADYIAYSYQGALTDQAISAAVTSNPLVWGRLVSRDGTTALIDVKFDPNADLNRLFDQVMSLIGAAPAIGEVGYVATIQRFLAGLFDKPQGTLGAVGFFMLDVASLRSIIFIATVVTTTALLLMAWFLRRRLSWQETIYTLLVLCMSPAVIVMGVLGWLGITVDTITGVIPVVFIAVGSSYGVHLATYIRKGRDQSIVAGVTQAVRPMLATALTTAAGFATLAPFEIQSIAKFGIHSAWGVLLLIYGFAILVAPAWFALLGLGQKPARTNAPQQRLLNVLLQLQARPKRTFLAVVVLTLASIVVWPNLQVGSRPTRFLSNESVIPATTDLLNSKFGANGQLLLAIDSGGSDDIFEPDFLAKVAALSDHLQGQEQIAFVESMPELLGWPYPKFCVN